MLSKMFIGLWLFQENLPAHVGVGPYVTMGFSKAPIIGIAADEEF